jgi:hypothetical protein
MERRKKMNQKRELNKEDWARIRSALDLYLRCQIGQLKDAFQIFMQEFEERTRENCDINESHKQMDINRVKWALERAEKEISFTAFGSTSASFGVKSLDDPIRQLIIQADLRYCNFSDDVTECPEYPANCCAPTTGWCPKNSNKEKSGVKPSLLSRLSSSIFQDKYAVVGSHPELGTGILTWNKTMKEAENNSTIINDSGGEARAVTSEEVRSMNLLRPRQEPKKEISLPYPSTSIKEGKYAVVGYHRDLGGGIMVWNKKRSEAFANKLAISNDGGSAEVVTKKSALSQKKS